MKRAAHILLWGLLASLALPRSAQERGKDKTPKPRRVIHAKPVPGSDTISITKPTNGYTLKDVVLEASPRAAILFFDHRGPFEGTHFDNVLIHVAPKTLPLDRAYWGVRGYDLVDTLFEHLEITGFGRVTDKHDEGHAIYLNPAGDFTLRDSFIHHNGGQGLQLVNRPEETSFPKGPRTGTITVEDTRFEENGFNPDRGAFTVSIFGTGQDVVLRNVTILAGLDGTAYPRGRTGGALVIEPEPYAPSRGKLPWWRPDDPPEDFTPPFTQGRVLLENVTVRFKDPSKPLLQIKGCKELIVRNCTFESVAGAPGRIELDLPDKPGRTNGHVLWEHNRGNARVSIAHRPVGPVSEDFEVGEEQE
ncbi:MAG TPA: hypothetical protein ENJ09_07325 [Planctomycetes bacterium]|nr:hypothetical protein [Planctomycetota bacterium]